MYEIKKIEKDQFDDAIKLSEYSFKYKLEGEAREKRKIYMKDHIIFGVYDNNHMIGKTHIIPLEILINGKQYKTGGVASVSTYPEYRRKGIVNQLMKLVHETMKEEGHVLSYLHPFNISFYRKYGYELVSNLKKLTISNRDFDYYKDVEGTLVRQEKNIHLDDIDKVYKAYIQRYNGMLVRSNKWWWDNQLNGELIAVTYYCKNQQPTGYLLYRIEDKKIKVEEYIYLDEDSRRGLWNYIANHDSMVEVAEIITADNDQMSFLFENPMVKTEIIPNFMGRILLLKEFLDSYIELSNIQQQLVLNVSDNLCSWNQGVFFISKNGIEFSPSNSKEMNRREGLSMDINTITAALLGFQNVDFLYNSNRISGNRDDLQRLNNIINQNDSWFLDNF